MQQLSFLLLLLGSHELLQPIAATFKKECATNSVAQQQIVLLVRRT